MSALPPSGSQPQVIPIEYTRGTGAFVPQASSGAAIATTVVAGNPNVTVADTTIPGQTDVSVTGTALVGTAFPNSPIDGELFFRTDLLKLFVFVAAQASWISAA